ncbi:MAG: acyl-CoA desaturase [Bdellovibrionaceae bacterium]|nr:acyl-CoA desaturase [Pseudobdellovibrionaceae bacterium]
MRADERFDWLGSIPYFTIHFLALGVFFFPFEWRWVGLFFLSYLIRMFGVTAGYHRYFSHRTYTLGRVSQFLLGWLASTSSQKGILWWAGNHRHHHRFSDMEEDIHSPIQRGFWWSHHLWILCERYMPTRWDLLKDWKKFPELIWLNQFWYIPVGLYGVLMYFLGGWPGFFWGFALSTVFLWHGTFTINSLSHVWGRRRFHTKDGSRNNGVLALVTLGEGWHNNHHRYMSASRQGMFWYELDITYLILKGLSLFGIVRGLRTYPVQIYQEALRLNTKSQKKRVVV